MPYILVVWTASLVVRKSNNQSTCTPYARCVGWWIEVHQHWDWYKFIILPIWGYLIYWQCNLNLMSISGHLSDDFLQLILVVCTEIRSSQTTELTIQYSPWASFIPFCYTWYTMKQVNTYFIKLTIKCQHIQLHLWKYTLNRIAKTTDPS